MTTPENKPTITVKGRIYDFVSLPDVLKETIVTHEQAMQGLTSARRSVAIHEIAVKNLAQTVETEIEKETPIPEPSE